MLHILYTETEVLLSKRTDATWREFQDTHPTFKTSLDPWNAHDVVAFLAEKYPNLVPSPDVQVAEFLASPRESAQLRFA
jgi:hypothetical protein